MRRSRMPARSVLSVAWICALLMVALPALDSLIRPGISESGCLGALAQADPCAGCETVLDEIELWESRLDNPPSDASESDLARAGQALAVAKNLLNRCVSNGCLEAPAVAQPAPPVSTEDPDPCLRGYEGCAWQWDGCEECVKRCYERYVACSQAYEGYVLLRAKYETCLECIARCDVHERLIFNGLTADEYAEQCRESYETRRSACDGDRECLERCEQDHQACMKVYAEYEDFKKSCEEDYQSFCEGDAETLRQEVIEANNAYIPLSTDSMACTATDETDPVVPAPVDLRVYVLQNDEPDDTIRVAENKQLRLVIGAVVSKTNPETDQQESYQGAKVSYQVLNPDGVEPSRYADFCLNSIVTATGAEKATNENGVVTWGMNVLPLLDEVTSRDWDLQELAANIQVVVTAKDEQGRPVGTTTATIHVIGGRPELTVTTADGETSGPPGTKVMASGGGFKRGGRIVIRWGEDFEVGSVIADSAGRVALQFQVPAHVEPGEYIIYAIGESGSASGQFLVPETLFLSFPEATQPGVLSFRNDYDPEIVVRLTNWGSVLSEEKEKELYEETSSLCDAGIILDLELSIRDSSGNEFQDDLRSVRVSRRPESDLYFHHPSLYRERPLEIEWRLSQLLEHIPEDWWNSGQGTYVEFLALKRANVNANALSSVVEPSAPLNNPVTVKIELKRATVFFETEPMHTSEGFADYCIPVTVGSSNTLEYKLGQAVTIDELVDIDTRESLTQFSIAEGRDFVLIFVPWQVSVPIHAINALFNWQWGKAFFVKAFWDFSPWAIQLMTASGLHEKLFYSTSAWKSAVSAASLVRGEGYTYGEPLWLNYETGDVAIIDMYGMIYPVLPPSSNPIVVPYFYVVSADSPFVFGGGTVTPTLEGIAGDRPEGREWEGPQADSHWLVKRDGTGNPHLRTGDGWVCMESRRGGQLVLQPHSLMDLRLIRIGDLFVKSPATILDGTVTVWNEPTTIGAVTGWDETMTAVFGERPEGFVSTLPEGTVDVSRPQVVATLRPSGTKYTVRVEANERFEVRVEEGSVDVLDRSGSLIETIAVGESKGFDFQRFGEQDDVNQSPTASFDAMPQQPIAGDIIVIVSTSSDPDGDTLSTSWYLDGEHLPELDNLSDWEWEDTEAGEYTILLRVEDEKGGIDEHSGIVEVRASGQESANRPPIASFALMPEDPAVGDPIVIVSTSSDPDGDSLIQTWYIDGEYEVSAGDLSEWTWSSPAEGEYTIGLVVMDGEGGVAEYSQTITVVAVEDEEEEAGTSRGGMSGLLYLLLIPAAAAVTVLVVRRRRRR